MEAVAHSPAFAHKVGISPSVGREFVAADAGRYAEGGAVDEGSRARAARNAPGFLDALSGLGQMIYGGARGAARSTLGALGELERLVRASPELGRVAGEVLNRQLSQPNLETWSRTGGRQRREATPEEIAGLVDSQDSLEGALSRLEAQLRKPTVMPDMKDTQGLFPHAAPGAGEHYEQLGEFAPLSPQAAFKLGRAGAGALGTLGRAAGTVLGGSLNPARPRLQGQLGAIRLKGGNFDDRNLASALVELGVPRTDHSENTVGELAVNAWGRKQLANYLKKDFSTPTDPLLAVEREGRGMHIPMDTAAADLEYELNDLMYASRGKPGSRSDAYRRRFIEPNLKTHGPDWTPNSYTPWEFLTDEKLRTEKLGDLIMNRYDIQGSDHPPQSPEEQLRNILTGQGPVFQAPPSRVVDEIKQNYGWAADKLNDPSYYLGSGVRDTGLDHVIDYLHNATEAHNTWMTRTNDDVARWAEPYATHAQLHAAGLSLDPQALSRLSVADAVRKTRDWNAFMEARSADTKSAALQRGIKGVYKDYPDQGFKWVELGMPDTAGMLDTVPIRTHTLTEPPLIGPPGNRLAYMAGEQGDPHFTGELFPSKEEAAQDYLARKHAEELQAGLSAEGDTMGHCVGGYCDSVVNGNTRILSLRDAQGNPHVTVELRPGRRNFESWYNKMDTDMYNVYKQELAEKLNREPRSHELIQHFRDMYASRNTPSPEDIIQIKGKGNRAPVAEYLPYVQDLVKSGNWGDIGDLGNTGLYDLKAPSQAAYSMFRARPDMPLIHRQHAWEAYKAANPDAKWATQDEVLKWLDANPDALKPLNEALDSMGADQSKLPRYAQGGRVGPAWPFGAVQSGSYTPKFAQLMGLE